MTILQTRLRRAEGSHQRRDRNARNTSLTGLVCVILLSVLVSACGKSTTAPSAYNQTITGSVDVFGTNRHALSITRAGTMTLSVTWQDSTVDLDLYLASTTCTSLYPKSSCNIIQSATSASGLTEQISRTVASGESYNIFVDNLSLTRTQSYSISINIQ